MIGNRMHLLLCVALVVAGAAAMAVWAGQARADTIPPFHVSGQVTDGSGAPLQDVHVILYRNTITPDADDPWFAADDEYTDIDGDYTLSYDTGYWGPPDQNDPGYEGTYAVLFWAPTVGVDTIYRPQWYDNAEGFFAQADIWQWDWQAQEIASSFAVAPTGIYKTGVDAVLEPYAGTIDGTVLDASTGLPLQNVTVSIFHYDKVTVGDTPIDENQVTTDANGRFTYSADPTLATDSWYTLLFDEDGYAKVWLGGVPYKAGVDDAGQSTGKGVGHFEVESNTASPITMNLLVSTSLTRPSVSAAKGARLTHGKKLAFAATLTPPAAAAKGTSRLRLWHRETKTVNGKKVLFWHLRSTLTMRASSSGKLTASGKLAYAGAWEMQVTYSSTKGCTACKSAMKTFSVR